MGVGHWLFESIIYDRRSGELLSNSTMAYQPPGCNDIPIDFRVKFVKSQSSASGGIPTNGTSTIS